MTEAIPKPPYDPELLAAAPQMPPALTPTSFAARRAMPPVTLEMIKPQLDELGLVHDEQVVERPGGNLTLSIVRPASAEPGHPAVYFIHGGGMIFGNRFNTFIGDSLSWAAEHQLAIVSPEYALAPEAPAPQGALDAYDGWVWLNDNATTLGIDPDRVILAGQSGGGGLAVSVALLARDRNGPAARAQLLEYPQLDDRNDTLSSAQFSAANGAHDPWPSETNRFAWDALLGEGHAEREVSIYESPARAEDLAGMPPTFIDASANEVFRDAAVAYAARLWACGVTAELHIWPGGFHGYDVMAPRAAVSLAAKAARSDWLRRVLSD